MCGRYAIIAMLEELQEQFRTNQVSLEMRVRKEVYLPTDKVIVINRNKGSNNLSEMRWSLIPHFIKDFEQIKKYSLFNARSESLEEKPAFRHLLSKNRCIIPADVFYEFKQEGKVKDKYAFTLKSKSTFAMAGLWDKWINPKTKEEIFSCTILTTTANEIVRPIHENNRMPVILEKEMYSDWLNEKINFSDCKNFILPYSSNKMNCEKVIVFDSKLNSKKTESIQKDNSNAEESQPSLFGSK